MKNKLYGKSVIISMCVLLGQMSLAGIAKADPLDDFTSYGMGYVRNTSGDTLHGTLSVTLTGVSKQRLLDWASNEGQGLCSIASECVDGIYILLAPEEGDVLFSETEEVPEEPGDITFTVNNIPDGNYSEIDALFSGTHGNYLELSNMTSTSN